MPRPRRCGSPAPRPKCSWWRGFPGGESLASALSGRLSRQPLALSPQRRDLSMARRRLTRRQFVEETGAMALGGMVVKRHVLGGPGYQAPSDTLNVAIVGAGGMGMSNAEALVTQNIVAVCDVDFGYVERAL